MDPLAFLELALIGAAAVVSFVISASVGLGGSLLLIPVLVLTLGAHEGVALGALLLGGNNVFKVIAYRRTIPWRAVAVVVLLIGAGAWLGASLMVRAPAWLVAGGVLLSFVATLIVERMRLDIGRTTLAPVLAFASGATSGFSGTSGPLKGAAIRNLDFDRAFFVGAASLASLVGDLTKTAVFAHTQILDARALIILALALPLMLLGTFSGFRMNRRLSEQSFAVLFWLIMMGYGVRIVAAIEN